MVEGAGRRRGGRRCGGNGGWSGGSCGGAGGEDGMGGGSGGVGGGAPSAARVETTVAGRGGEGISGVQKAAAGAEGVSKSQYGSRTWSGRIQTRGTPGVCGA